MQLLCHIIQIIESGKPAFLTSPSARTAFERMMFYVCFVTSLSACGGGSSENLAADVPVVNAPSAAPSPAPTPTPTPPNPPHNHGEHCEMIPSFASETEMTHIATQSGNWSDPETWNGQVPENGANVFIPFGIEVSVKRELLARLGVVRVDGAMTFSSLHNTEMRLETLFSSCSGQFVIGTADAPVSVGVKATVMFIDSGPIQDEKRLSRGAILMGKTRLYGSTKTHKAILTPQAKRGESRLILGTQPIGWQQDDQLVVTGTLPGDPRSDEIRSINQISGNEVWLNSPLAIDHVAPLPTLNVYVANITRNIEFRSENTVVSRRGHIMFPHNQDVEIHNVRFSELGRTDKTQPLDDFRFDFHDGGDGDDAPATAEIVSLGGSNVRGRYAVHFHRTGTDVTTKAAQVKGSVVYNGPGWGFVSHSSHVDFIDNVAYGLQGAGFYTEAGDEVGSMQGNIAIRSVNQSFTLDDQGAIDPDLRANLMDYGHDGDGFWLTGNRVRFINNVASGATAHGIIYWTDGIIEADHNAGNRVSIPTASLENGHLIPNRQSIPVWWAPFAENRGNESYGATVGFRIRYVHAKHYLGRDEQSEFHRSPPQAYIDTLTPSVNELTVWGNRDGVLLNYNERLSLNGATIVGFGKDVSRFSFNPGTAKSGIGLDIGNDATHGSANVSNTTIQGFGMGLATPVNGRWHMNNVSMFDNNTDMIIQPPETDPTQVFFQNVQYQSFQVVDGEDNELPEHIIVNNG